MYYVAETESLIADGVISEGQADEIKSRARTAMVALCVNALLIAGIIAATLGLVFYLASALSVAICGGLFLAVGLLILRHAASLYRMFGNASSLIGAGMLISGTGIELADKIPDAAGWLMIVIGAVIFGLCTWRFRAVPSQLRFAYGAVLLMGGALHIVGIYFSFNHAGISGWPMPFVHFYVFAFIVALGVFLDTRLITALAIAPFAQMLDTGTYYFSAAYVFYSPEPTLSILQMSLLIGACLWAANRWGGRISRQAGILMIMAFVVANLCFLVGSIWGDVLGETWWGPTRDDFDDYSAYFAERDTFRAAAFNISEQVYAVIWAVLLAILIIWTALSNRRGLFNTGMTFAAIHGYTQMFESFSDEPLAYVIGGLAAIPLAFGLWRLNNVWFQPLDVAGAR
ncbi:hypothetical protein [Ruegeria halocynthiae]|uniref:hypothetical protein n=1 Tax=Ruegeria halocynthiae TaxID=985054 RepID=UPI00056385E0|nr:hypothetical protein [Ruegeria halocynthiae]